MGLVNNVFVLLATVAIASVVADNDLTKAADDATTIKDGATFCPVPVIGTRCPDGSVFHYYKCCGDLNKDCCFNLQVWVIVVLAVIAVIIIAGFVLSILRCLFCRK
jgi:hypothetical protein